MKKIAFWVVLITVSTADIAIAQTAKSNKTGSWIVGADLGFKSDLTTPSIGTADGKRISTAWEVHRPWSLYGGYKPVGGFGGEVRFKKFRAEGAATGSVTRPLVIWSVDATPGVFSTIPPTRGPQNFMEVSSVKFSQFDLLVNRTWGLSGGAVSAFAGLSAVNVDSKEDISITQKFLLTARLISGALDPIATGETFAASSSATNKYRGIGPTIGAEGEYCLIGGLIIEGRGAFTLLPWGSNDSTALFTYTKDVNLVNTADGINGPVRQTVARLNLAPNQSQFTDSSRETGTVVDLKGVLKWRFHLSGIALDLGGGVVWTSFDGPSEPRFVIPGPFAAGQGMWEPRSKRFTLLSPVFITNVWF
jgi:hypothetical protein